MKIAVSGSAGVGKTTFSRQLAEDLNVSHIAEGYDEFYDESGHVIQPHKRLAEAMVTLANKKFALEKRAGRFVSDRCPVD